MEKIDLLIREIAGSPYTIFLSLLLAALPILYFLISKSMPIAGFLVGTIKVGLKRQIQRIRIRRVIGFKSFSSGQEFYDEHQFEFLRIANFSLLLIIYLFAATLLLVAIDLSIADEQSLLSRLQEKFFGFAGIFAIVFGTQYIRFRAHLDLRIAFKRWAQRNKIPFAERQQVRPIGDPSKG